VTTAAAAQPRPTSATLHGQVAPNGRPTSYHFEYGKTAAYGARTLGADAGSGVPARPVFAALTGLTPATTYHYRVVASNSDGTSAGGDRTFRTAAPDTTAPVITAASATPSVFAVDPNGTSETPLAAAARGTTIRYRLSEAARVVFTIQRRSTGRKVGKKCRKKTRKNRGRKHCARYTGARRFAQRARAGANSKRFDGAIGTQALKPGRYRATLVATDAAGNKSRPKRLSFRVVRK
jgi:hypothetical protein